MEMMIQEKRRRDASLERLVDRVITPSVPGSTRETTSEAFHIMPDLSKGIQNFDEEKDGIQVKEWLANINRMKQLHTCPNVFVFETAQAHLNSGAFNWFRLHSTKIKSWSDFEYAFKKTFIKSKGLTEKWQRMYARTQQKGKSVNALFMDKARLCQQLDLSIDETKEKILIVLWFRDL